MGLFGAILGALGSSGDDGRCDWVCDECDAYMNDQPGFTVSGGSWTCTECGAVNDVTPNNVLDLDDDDDYFGSADYYRDEEKRRREEEEDLWELGIDPYD